MIKVDWSLAPKWADRVVAGPLSGKQYWANEERRIKFGGEFDCKDDNHITEGWTTTEFKPKPWSGPEDGLPPVGLKCMHGEEVVEILAHRAFKGHEHDPLLVVFATADDVSFSSPCCFRPIVRADQIAAEKRETAIREFMDVVGIDCRVTASKAVDAGFKREVV